METLSFNKECMYPPNLKFFMFMLQEVPHLLAVAGLFQSFKFVKLRSAEFGVESLSHAILVLTFAPYRTYLLQYESITFEDLRGNS